MLFILILLNLEVIHYVGKLRVSVLISEADDLQNKSEMCLRTPSNELCHLNWPYTGEKQKNKLIMMLPHKS